MFHFLFPGQGSQHPGMGKFLFENFSRAKATFEEASDALEMDIRKLCFEGSEQELAKTENTQPALLTVSTATQRVLIEDIGTPVIAASGHSIGEYGALVVAGSIGFSAAVKAVRLRGQFMQSAVPLGVGGMTAVMGLEPQQVDELCLYVNKQNPEGFIQAANYNCPGQIVISGHQKSLLFMKDQIKIEDVFPQAKRVKFIPLQVSAPFHSQLMIPAEKQMRDVLTEMEFKDARIPVIQNLTAKTDQNASELRENLIRQISGPVRWMQSMELAKQNQWTLCIESGAGKVLAGLNKKIDAERFHVHSVNSLEDIKNIEQLLTSNPT
jgi:[acyl-carrier-protein] S-malonyltransferase